MQTDVRSRRGSWETYAGKRGDRVRGSLRIDHHNRHHGHREVRDSLHFFEVLHTLRHETGR